ncbi:bis(5'-nucleosyl)-tetraphosphatase PrpE [asymmetrical] [Parasteatoda tepidariorum]|uniref:bis(5'-nucleosyl)-tetraphosphatase PrpE [asymmetrical] n=1 Tax=Parasteatoda tepidariorum TaxID=114398 RepID=UPI00077F9A09|nr:bis(5'-nucleosyl)-tetraphosphatase PrpE [asymmetrical] [Parasteatoda tepidariorum]
MQNVSQLMQMQQLFVTCFVVAVATLILRTSADDHRCDHPTKDTGYPPKVFHQVLNASVINKYDEVVVIGDVHGCLDELKLLLEKSNTTGDNVLKVLAGDITRKGPKSIGVIRFLRQTPSIITVRGNNDQKILMRHFKHHHFNYHLKKQDMFIVNMTMADFHFMQHLPYTISMPSLNAVVVHGGLRPGVPLRHNQPYDMMNMRNLIKDSRCAGGYRPYNGDDKGARWAPLWQGPVHVYFAHDHPRNMQISPFATGLDTSCVYGRYLTGLFLKGPRKGQVVQQKALKQYFHH